MSDNSNPCRCPGLTSLVTAMEPTYGAAIVMCICCRSIMLQHYTCWLRRQLQVEEDSASPQQHTVWNSTNVAVLAVVVSTQGHTSGAFNPTVDNYYVTLLYNIHSFLKSHKDNKESACVHNSANNAIASSPR